MILKFIVLFWMKVELCYCSAKAGVSGIKIKSSTKLDNTTEYLELYAVLGSTVLLPCNLTPPSTEDAILLVLWYRMDLHNPIYTLDSRGNPQPKHYSSSGILGSRAIFNVSRETVSYLRIDPVEEEDKGEYRCRVDYKRRRTLNQFVRLNVIVPVKKLFIRGSDNITYSGLIGPFTEGDKLVLICEAIGGRPSPIVIWRKGSAILHGTSIVDDNGDVRNELVFHRLLRQDLLSSLVCKATNSNLTKSVHTSVTIDLNLRPLSIQITTPPGHLKSGDALELNCQCEGSRPPARITWTKGTETVTHFAIHNVYGSIAVSSLTIQLTTDDNGKNLTCRAENPQLPESALQDSLNLNVQFLPIMSLVFGTSVQYEQVREGSDVYFECNIQANPPVTRVHWKFESSNLVNSSKHGVELRNQSLVLHNVGIMNRGRYQCEADNALGKGASEEVVLRIQHSPICSSHQQRTYSINRNTTTNITCGVDADPPGVTFTWKQNNKGVLQDIKGLRTFEQDARSILEYNPVMETDYYGRLMCHARNSIGTMKEPCVFSVIQAGPPPAPRNCAVVNSTTSTFHVICEQESFSVRQTYHLEIYNIKGEELLANLTSNHKPEFLVNNLPPESTFIVVVYSIGDRGRSETVALTTSTLLHMERHTVADSESGSLLTVVILASLAVVSTLAVLALITGIIVVKSKSPLEAAATLAKITEKHPNSTKHSYEEQNTYIYHTSDIPKAGSSVDFLYGDLMDKHGKAFETVMYKTHSLPEEEIEVILPVIER